MLTRVTQLFRSLAIYGVGDVATSLVSFLLLPVYARFLTPADYGIVAMLLVIEAVQKIIFRWGIDTAFMRLFYDAPGLREQQRLASTQFFFMLAVNGVLLFGGVASAGWLSTQLFDTPDHALLIAIVTANTFVAGFYFLPLQVLRIRQQPRTFIALTFVRSFGTLVMRLVLVIAFGLGVFGIVLADIAMTVVFTVILVPRFAELIRPVFSRSALRESLSFGLPRLPHAIASQLVGLADRYFLNAYRTLAEVGVYSIGATFGQALKLFLSAFEFAWTPFFLGVMKEPDAKHIYGRVSTYIVALLVLLVGGLCATAADVIRVMVPSAFHEAAIVTPWIALGVMFQGLYLVASIGLIITKRTAQYPIATGIAAGASILANWFLVPRYGILGAAWSNAIAYGVLMVTTAVLSWRVYPIPYEWARLTRVAAAAAVGFVAASRLVPAPAGATGSVLVRGTTMVVVYGGVLFATGFFHAGELSALRDLRQRVIKRQVSVVPAVVDNAGSEMAGETVGTAPQVSAEPASPDFRSRDR